MPLLNCAFNRTVYILGNEVISISLHASFISIKMFFFKLRMMYLFFFLADLYSGRREENIAHALATKRKGGWSKLEILQEEDTFHF